MQGKGILERITQPKQQLHRCLCGKECDPSWLVSWGKNRMVSFEKEDNV